MSPEAERYLKSYYGIELLKKYNLKDIEVWNVLGEDPNCDFGGTHTNPQIAVVGGVLEQVVEWAIKQPNFWTWGVGGKIEKLDIKNVKDLI